MFMSASPTPALSDDGVVIASRAYYPEGLLWDSENDALFFAEMTNDRIIRFVNNTTEEFIFERNCGPTSIARIEQSMLVACHIGGYILITDKLGMPKQRIRFDTDGLPINNPNDIAADGNGGAYISDSGQFSSRAPATGAILHWRSDGSLNRVASNLRYPNGLLVNEEGKLLVSEHLARRILIFPIIDNGRLNVSSYTTFADLSAELNKNLLSGDPLLGPDGLDQDDQGRVFAAIYGAGQVMMFAKDGEVLGFFPRPETFTTTVAVGPKPYLFIGGAFSNRHYPYLGQVAQVSLENMRSLQMVRN